MIGCERLCGKCTACGPLVWALKALGAGYRLPEMIAKRTEWGRAALTPELLAALIERAMRGRGLVFSGAEDPDNCWIDALEAEAGNPCDGVLIHPMALTMPQARAVLSRLLALPLDCGADAAIAALEE